MLLYIPGHNYCIPGVCWQIEVDKSYQEKLCGLCGNFDGEANDVMSNGEIIMGHTHMHTQINTSQVKDTLAQGHKKPYD